MPEGELVLDSNIRFVSRIFRIAAIYGVIVLAPLYLAPVPDPWRVTHFGFIGLALVFQGMFWIISRDPLHYRALIPIAIWEKLCFGIPAVGFFLRGQVDTIVGVFGALDLFWALVFTFAMRRLAQGN